MKCKVTAPFRDKFDRSIKYNIGDVVEWNDKDRIANCIEQGLIEAIKEEKPKAKNKTKAD